MATSWRESAFGRSGILRTTGQTRQVRWVKASASGDAECVEIAALDSDRYVRDSTDAEGPVVRLSSASWTELLKVVRERGR